jgi:hypothetical protein
MTLNPPSLVILHGLFFLSSEKTAAILLSKGRPKPVVSSGTKFTETTPAFL